jgi:hypothetical protein
MALSCNSANNKIVESTDGEKGGKIATYLRLIREMFD